MYLPDEPADREPQRLQGCAGSWRATVRDVQVPSGRDSAHVDPGALHVFRHWKNKNL